MNDDWVVNGIDRRLATLRGRMAATSSPMTNARISELELLKAWIVDGSHAADFG